MRKSQIQRTLSLVGVLSCLLAGLNSNVAHGAHNTSTNGGVVKSINGNGNIITESSHKIYGNGNIINGSGNTIHGNGNIISGHGNKANGNGNIFIDSSSHIVTLHPDSFTNRDEVDLFVTTAQTQKHGPIAQKRRKKTALPQKAALPQHSWHNGFHAPFVNFDNMFANFDKAFVDFDQHFADFDKAFVDFDRHFADFDQHFDRLFKSWDNHTVATASNAHKHDLISTGCKQYNNGQGDKWILYYGAYNDCSPKVSRVITQKLLRETESISLEEIRKIDAQNGIGCQISEGGVEITAYYSPTANILRIHSDREIMTQQELDVLAEKSQQYLKTAYAEKSDQVDLQALKAEWTKSVLLHKDSPAAVKKQSLSLANETTTAAPVKATSVKTEPVTPIQKPEKAKAEVPARQEATSQAATPVQRKTAAVSTDAPNQKTDTAKQAEPLKDATQLPTAEALIRTVLNDLQVNMPAAEAKSTANTVQAQPSSDDYAKVVALVANYLTQQQTDSEQTRTKANKPPTVSPEVYNHVRKALADSIAQAQRNKDLSALKAQQDKVQAEEHLYQRAHRPLDLPVTA